jgi:hypothetical protein
MRAVNFSQNIWPLPQNHGQTREANTVMSTIQLSAWMFPSNTARHHKSNAKDGTQIRSQSRKPQTKQIVEPKILWH